VEHASAAEVLATRNVKLPLTAPWWIVAMIVAPDWREINAQSETLVLRSYESSDLWARGAPRNRS
jgi:hypothetical protein